MLTSSTFWIGVAVGVGGYYAYHRFAGGMGGGKKGG